MKQDLDGKTVVIVGASSGIGRAAALAFADKGADVVLAARRELALREVAGEIESRGRRALVVPTDVTDEDQVVSLAVRAREAFGQIDVWVNDAGVSAVGTFTDIPIKDAQRVIETDIFGVMFGTRAVLPIFLEQQQGVLINIASVVADLPQPFASPYVAAKAAVRAFSASVRQELMLRNAKHVHVVTVLPAVIDTPFFASAGNYMGRNLVPPPPVNSPEVVSKAIVDAAMKPAREVYAGKGGRFMSIQMKLAPALAERSFARFVEKTHFGDEAILPPTGNLFTPPSNNGAIDGGWSTVPKAPGGAKRATIAAGLGATALLLWRKTR